MAALKWNRLSLPPALLPDKDNVYELVVFADQHQNFYFFGNTLLWCLGYAKPHIALQSLVEPEDRLKLAPTDNAIYLAESTAKQLIEEKVRQRPEYEPFSDWFTSYLNNCKGSNPSENCPQ